MNFLHLFPKFKMCTLCYKACYTTKEYDNKNSKEFFKKFMSVITILINRLIYHNVCIIKILTLNIITNYFTYLFLIYFLFFCFVVIDLHNLYI